MPARRALGLALAVAFLGAAGPCRALELMTGDGYLLALAEDESARLAADSYLAGTLESLIVLNEILATEESPLFCLSDERASVLKGGLLRQDFTDWLKAVPVARNEDEAAGAMPVSMLAWAFLAQKFPCAAPTPDGDDPEVRSRLRESAPR